MIIKKALTAAVITPLLAGVISGCSDSSSSSSSVSFYLQAGQEDIDEGHVRVVLVNEGGQLAEDQEGRLSGSVYTTDENGEVRPNVSTEEVYYFELVGHVADTNVDTDPTTVRCQWAEGCVADSRDYSFGDDVARTDGLGWRTVAYDLNKNERIRLTPLTDLVAQLAYDYVYDEDATADPVTGETTPIGWDATGYYSPYSIEQAISQVSQIFGIDSVENRRPADLTKLSGWAGQTSPGAVYSIRYGALIAAWNHLAENYNGDFTRDVSAEFSANEGQLPEDGSGYVVTLKELYTAALTNLQTLSSQEGIEGVALTTVINDLTQDIDGFTETLTDAAPAPLSELFGSASLNDFKLGIARSKAFVDVMRNYENTFFEEGYREVIESYRDMVQAIGREHSENFDAVIDRYINIKDLYVDTYLNNGGNNICAATGAYAWMSSVTCSYNASSAVMRLTDNNGTNISVSQKVADVNTSDDDDEPTESHAIDVLITGRYKVGELSFVVDNTYHDDDPDEDIISPTGIRIYYTDEVSHLVDDSNNEIIAYEMRWSDFSLYQQDLPDSVNGVPVTQDDIEASGSFRIFYRGVRDPLNAASELRFNIDTVVLNGRVSDVVGDDDEDDNNFATVYIAASAANASDYYPEKTWASFNGFFDPNTSYTVGDSINNLLTYQRGTQTISGQQVDYLDVKLMADGVALEDSARYRFYPSVQREDDNDIDNDGDTDELIYTHDIEICDLTYDEDTSEWSVGSCDPKQRLRGERDTDQAINDLWEAGTFSRVTVPGRGEYFVTWPANDDDNDSCLALNTLADNGGPLAGELYEPMVLGLNLARLTTEVQLQGKPDTALDILAYAKTADRYTLSAALSHDYSRLSNSNSGVYYGVGNNIDRVMLSLETDSNYAVTGNVAVYKDGVSLTAVTGVDSQRTDRVDSSLGLYVNRRYTTPVMPYHYVTDEEGNYDICVTDNIAENVTPELEGSVYYLNFRDVVYGSIRNENGAWVIRYIDGSFEAL